MERRNRRQRATERSKWTFGIAGTALFLLIIIISSACNSGYTIGAGTDPARDIDTTQEIPEALVRMERDAQERRAEEAYKKELAAEAEAIKEMKIEPTAEPSIEPVKEPTAEEEAQETEPPVAETETAPEWKYSEHDEELLLKIAMAEAEGEGEKGKALVMMVVINRAEDDHFPNSIEGVIFQKLGDYYQFSPVQDGGIINGRKPDAQCYAALDMIKDGWDESEGATFFEASYSTSTWHRNNLEYLFQYGGHVFYKLP